MSNIIDRIASIIEKHLTCECGNWAKNMHENCLHAAEQVAKDLQLTEETYTLSCRCEKVPFAPHERTNNCTDVPASASRWVSRWETT